MLALWPHLEWLYSKYQYTLTYGKDYAVGLDLVAILDCKGQITGPGQENDYRTLHAAGLKVHMWKCHLRLIVCQVKRGVVSQCSTVVAVICQLDGCNCLVTDNEFLQEDPVDLSCLVILLQRTKSFFRDTLHPRLITDQWDVLGG